MSGVVGDGSVNTDDAFLEESREYVVGAFSPGRILNHHRNQAVAATIDGHVKWEGKCGGGGMFGNTGE